MKPRRTRYKFTYRCPGCGDTFNTDTEGRKSCDACRFPLRLPIGQGTPHNCPAEDPSFHRVERVLEDDATDSGHLDHQSECGK